MSRSQLTALWAVTFNIFLLAGCSSEPIPVEIDPAEPGSSQTQSDSSDEAETLPTASIGSGGAESQPAVAPNAAPEKGSPAWLIAEIKKIRSKGLESIGPNTSLEQMRAARRERSEQIMTLATEVIKQTHDDPQQEQAFNEAVRQLMEARVQLALQGKAEDIDALYADVESLRQRSANSKAAAEATHSLLMFTNTNAGRYGAQDARWLEEFARMATLFASDYPEDTRSATALFAAGLSCDMHGQRELAIQSFETLVSVAEQSIQAQQAVPILRRLKLIGQPLQLAGPTLEGGFVDAEELKGRFAIIVYWASDNAQFQEAADSLVALGDKYQRYVRMLGICLDEDESAIDAYMEQTTLPWQHIFDPDHRRWDNKVVKYYGVRNIPQYWIVDHKGIVRVMTADASQLEELLRAELLKVRQATTSNGN